MALDEENINEVFREFDAFLNFSGLTVNYTKTVILPTESTDPNVKLNLIQPVKWTVDPIHILGILVHPNMRIMLEINYSPQLQKMRYIIMMC